MTQLRYTRAILAFAVMVGGAFLAVPRSAEAHPPGGFHGGVAFHGSAVYVRPYFAFGFGYGYPFYPFAWGPYWGWGPYAYGPPGGVDMSAAFVAGYGAVDMNVKPGAAEVWVDGKFVAEAKDLDGDPSYLWLPEGVHHVIVYKGGYARFEEDIEVQRGYRKQLKIRMEKGESEPPGLRPGKPTEKPETKPESKKTDLPVD
jgi:hypothetical protein